MIQFEKKQLKPGDPYIPLHALRLLPASFSAPVLYCKTALLRKKILEPSKAFEIEEQLRVDLQIGAGRCLSNRRWPKRKPLTQRVLHPTLMEVSVRGSKHKFPGVRPASGFEGAGEHDGSFVARRSMPPGSADALPAAARKKASRLKQIASSEHVC